MIENESLNTINYNNQTYIKTNKDDINILHLFYDIHFIYINIILIKN